MPVLIAQWTSYFAKFHFLISSFPIPISAWKIIFELVRGIDRSRWTPLIKGQLCIVVAFPGRNNLFNKQSRCRWFATPWRSPVMHQLHQMLKDSLSFGWVCSDHIHYSDVIMSAMASQITGVSIVYSTVCSGTDQRKHQSSTSLAFVKVSHWWLVNSPHKGPVMRKMFPFDDVFMHQFMRQCQSKITCTPPHPRNGTQSSDKFLTSPI